MWCMGSAGCGCKRFDYDPNMKYVIMAILRGIFYIGNFLRKYWKYTSKTCVFIPNMLKLIQIFANKERV